MMAMKNVFSYLKKITTKLKNLAHLLQKKSSSSQKKLKRFLKKSQAAVQKNERFKLLYKDFQKYQKSAWHWVSKIAPKFYTLTTKTSVQLLKGYKEIESR